MNAPLDDPSLPADQTTVVTRAANEGIPIAAIARVIQQPFDMISEALRFALARGQIGSMPRPDWPPAAKWSERLPTSPRSANPEDVEFACRKVFRLTSLEAGFMMVLLRYECADKERLHNVIEQQRQARAQMPSTTELTDPKMVDVMICKLRKKLKNVAEEFVVVTSWGKGYYFEPAVKQKIYAMIGGPYGTSEGGGPPVERAPNSAGAG